MDGLPTGLDCCSRLMRLAAAGFMDYQQGMPMILSLEVIRHRRTEAQQALHAARNTISACEAILRELEIAERFVKQFGVERQDSSISDRSVPNYSVNPSPDIKKKFLFKLGSIKPELGSDERDAKISPTEALMVNVLKVHKDTLWMTANEIQEWASVLKGSEIPMSTISPLLTKLKNEGVIVRDGLRVALAERLTGNEAPTDKSQREPQTVQAGSTIGGEDADSEEAADAE